MKEARHKRTNTVRSPLYQIPRIGKFIEAESRIQISRDWGKRLGSFYIMVTELLFGGIKKFWRDKIQIVLERQNTNTNITL